MSTFDVKALVEQGHTYVDVPADLVDRAREEYLRLISRNKNGSVVACYRPGEDEPDLGIIFKNGAQSDYKYYLHYAHDWTRYVELPLVASQLRALPQLYQFNNRLALAVGAALVQYAPTLFPPKLLGSLALSGNCSVPYGTPVLCGLYYPASVGSRVQTGAMRHYDRSFLTIHLGDFGGELLAHGHESDTVGVGISPPPGKAVVFFGVKVAILTGDRIKPLWHSSKTVPGEDRTAMVHFAHIDVGRAVTNAGEAYRQFKEELTVAS